MGPCIGARSSGRGSLLRRLSAGCKLWAVEVDGSFVGSVRIHTIDQTDKRAALAIGFKDSNHIGQELGTEALKLALGYAMGPMDLHRIPVRVIAYNRRAIRACEKCGFVREGVEREAVCAGAVWYDDVSMGVLSRDFATLQEPALKNMP
jgi:RimJ/RimL family protein N-acetyltransferase